MLFRSWLNYGEKTLDGTNINYEVFEHTDAYGRKYYTYKIINFSLNPDTAQNIIIPRTMKVWYKLEQKDAILEEIGSEVFLNSYLNSVKITGYKKNTSVYVPVKIGKEAFAGNFVMMRFDVKASEMDAKVSEIGESVFEGNYLLSKMNIEGTTDYGIIGKKTFLFFCHICIIT